MSILKKAGKIVFMVLFLATGLIFFSPIILTMINGFKTMPELSKSFFAVPKALSFDNFREVINLTNFWQAFYNSCFITVVSVAGIVLISMMASYAIVRRNSRFNQVIYIVFVMGMVMPFTTIMIPTMKLFGFLNISGKWGLILEYWALGASLAVFLLSGFLKSSVPIELEEAARIDGANAWRIFFRIVFPLLRPSIMTIIMIDTIWIWNDFLLPSLLLYGKVNRTLPLSQHTLVGQYVQKFTLQFAAFTLAMLPLFILFFTCQKYIIRGVAAGSVKG